jgi:tungstate transport system permease protein
VSETASAASLSLGLSAASVAIASTIGVPRAVALGLSRSRRRDIFLVAARVGMTFPTVVVGLVVYGLFSHDGPLGSLGLLYTAQAIVVGEVLLALPLVVALGAAAIGALDPRVRDTAHVLGSRGHGPPSSRSERRARGSRRRRSSRSRAA